jgi:hypothetical protein
MMTVWMMGIATACIGLLPSFNQIGWWAPVLLVISITHLHAAAIERLFVFWRAFNRQQRRAAPFAADGEASSAISATV